MDGLKLDKCRGNFQSEVKNVETESNAFFNQKQLGEYYSLVMGESDEFSLKISDDLQAEIKERFMHLLLTTKPEDSV